MRERSNISGAEEDVTGQLPLNFRPDVFHQRRTIEMGVKIGDPKAVV